MISELFNTVFYQPLFNILILLYGLVPDGDFGLAVVFLTILIKILLHPFNVKAIKSQKALSDLEPRLKEIRGKFKNDKEKMAKETFELYRKAKVNPFSSIVLIFIQLPILIALYKVFLMGGFNNELSGLYSFVPYPGKLNPYFLGTNLSQPNLFLAVLAGFLQFFQAKVQNVTVKTGTENPSQFAEILKKQMLYFFPFFTFFILLKIPSAIALYLIVNGSLSILETIYVFKKKKSEFK